jgi:hypothetical protein
MIGGARLVLFSLVSMITYTLAYYFNWAPFRLYPASADIEWLRPSHADSVSISWYGWIAAGVLAGALVASLTPGSLVRRIPTRAAWLIPMGLFAATLLYEKRWFF